MKKSSMHWFRFAPIPLAAASFLAWAPPAAAIDTTNYEPFATEVICKNVSNFACGGSLALPNNRHTVLEYVSVTCTNLTPGARLYSLAIGVTTNGVSTAHFIELPLAASIGWPPGVRLVVRWSASMPIRGRKSPYRPMSLRARSAAPSFSAASNRLLRPDSASSRRAAAVPLAPGACDFQHRQLAGAAHRNSLMVGRPARKRQRRSRQPKSR